MSSISLPEGLVVVVKHDCETCVEIVPALEELAGDGITVISQDDPAFPPGMPVIFDKDLAISWSLGTEVTPTLYRVSGGVPVELAVGWRRAEWRRYTNHGDLGSNLAEHRPGCGSITMDPDVYRRLSGEPGAHLTSRRVELGSSEDTIEAMYARGWSDGLPLVPPTPDRVAAMLTGTTSAPGEHVAEIPPNYAPATVEKIAINAVMAGCRPEYLPVVLTAARAVCTDDFNLHGVAATTFFSGPVIIVNGPIADEIGMNSTYNAFGPGNRANATIGRAVNLVIRNVGGAVPGGVDRSTMGHPAKWTACVAEREADSPWPALAADRGVTPGTSAVTVFAGQGPTPVVDQLSREPDSLARTFAASLQTVGHQKLAMGFDAIIAMSPEHVRVFDRAGWSKQQTIDRILELTEVPAPDRARGARGMAEGIPPSLAESFETGTAGIPKFTVDGLSIIRVGSDAGLFSGIISSWARGPRGSMMVTLPVED